MTNSGSAAVGGNQIVFSGAIDENSLGINLDNNDLNNGATITFTGGLDIDSTTNTGFNATNGGTVNVTASSNTIDTTSGVALNVTNTNIGLGDLNFLRISSNGAASGIILNNTGTTAGTHGGLMVTGDAGSAVNGSGGVITGSTGAGISITNARDVSLDQMTIQNGLGDGILASSVTNFSLTNSTVTNNGDQLQEHGIDFTNLLGTGTFTNLTISNNETSQVEIINTSGSATVTFDNVDISSTGLASTPNGLHGLRFETQGTASADLIVQNGSSFNNLFSNSIHATNEGTGTLEFTVTDTDFNNIGASAINLVQNNSGTVRFNIHDNDTFLRNSNNGVSHTININQAGGTPAGAILEGRINNNVIGDSSSSNSGSTGGYGIQVFSVGSGTTTVQIDHNNIQGTAGGIRVQMGEDTNPAHTMNATINDNTVLQTAANSVNGIRVNIGTLTGDAGIGRIDMYNNTSTMSGAAAANFGNAISVETRFNTSIQMPGYTGGSSDFPAIQTYLDSTKSNNAIGGVPWDISTDAAPGGFFNTSPAGSPIPTPNLPTPLLAGAGGVQASSPTPGDTDLTPAELNSVIAAAIALWEDAGASTAQLAALAAITFSVANLAGNAVGEHTQGHIVIDTDAAGHGWFIDSTLSDNIEFAHAANADGTQLFADPASAAAGHLDLLTAVVHEMGHELGLDHSDEADDVMADVLVDGERRLPDAADLAPANAGQTAAQAPLMPVIRGTAGNDTINAGFGGNILVGLGGADNFVFTNVAVGSSASSAAHPCRGLPLRRGRRLRFLGADVGLPWIGHRRRVRGPRGGRCQRHFRHAAGQHRQRRPGAPNSVRPGRMSRRSTARMPATTSAC